MAEGREVRTWWGTPPYTTARRAGRLVRRVLQRLVSRANAPGPQADAFFLALAAAVGLLGALGVELFFNLIDLANDFLVVRPMAAGLPVGRWVIVPLLTGGALALAAWIMRRFGDGYEGLNVPDVSHAVRRELLLAIDTPAQIACHAVPFRARASACVRSAARAAPSSG